MARFLVEHSSSCAVPGDEVHDVFIKKFGPVDYIYGISQASTDFVSGLCIQWLFMHVLYADLSAGKCDIWCVFGVLYARLIDGYVPALPAIHPSYGKDLTCLCPTPQQHLNS